MSGGGKAAALGALAAVIAGPRTVVAGVFAAVAGASGDPAQFEGVAVGTADDLQAYTAALTHADQNGWLLPLIHGLLTARATGNDFVSRGEALFPQDALLGQIQLQATQNVNDAAVPPAVLGWILTSSARQVCRIDIDGEAKGTGFLIRPALALTGYHVVAPLVADGNQQPGSTDRLTVAFDDQIVIANGVRRRLPPLTVSVAQQWLISSSACPPQEMVGTQYGDFDYIAALNAQTGPWDFALIRLEKTVDPDRSGLPLNDLAIRAGEPIMILQHAAGRPLIWAMANVAMQPPPGKRFFHSVWTKPGSSGGPCLNMEGRVVGIHQAGPATLVNGQPPALNRALPILPFAENLMTSIAKVPSDPAFLLNLSADQNHHPVLGRDATQQWIWRAAETQSTGGTAKPILVVASSRPRRGARFTEKILRSLLPTDRHLVVSIDAGNLVAATPRQFAETLVMTATGAAAPSLPANEDDTTVDNWIRKTLVPAAMDAIGRARGDRLVWFVLRFPPALELPDKTKIRETLDAFYAQPQAYAWMRLVLLGLGSMLSPPLDQAAELERLRPLGLDDLVGYVTRRWPGQAQREMIKALIRPALANLDPDAENYQESIASVARQLDASLKEIVSGAGS